MYNEIHIIAYQMTVSLHCIHFHDKEGYETKRVYMQQQFVLQLFFAKSLFQIRGVNSQLVNTRAASSKHVRTIAKWRQIEAHKQRFVRVARRSSSTL